MKRLFPAAWFAIPVSAIICAVAPTASAEDAWPQFLGPARTGVAPATGLLDSLDGESPQVAWRVGGGVGMSGVAVANGYAVTMWNSRGQQMLVALNAQTGKTRWQVPVAPAYENSQGNGPRATPAIDGDRVFAYSGEGVLVATDLKSGQLLWTMNAVRRSGGKPSEYGMSGSPLVVDDRVIVHVGGQQSAISAFDTKTGAPIWVAGSGTAAYSSPTLIEVAEERHLVCFIGSGVVGLDPASGEELWFYPFKTPYDCNTATPIGVDGAIFISAGENHGCVLLDVKRERERYTVSERWASVDTKSVMRNEWQTSVVVDGYLYGFDNVGGAGPVTHLSCINATTGEPVWQQKRFGKGNLTLADGKLWITTMEGELVLVKVSPTGYQELGRKPLFGKTRQSLSIAGKFGFIRDDRDVICLNLAK